jgi:hypothetical protein
MVSEFFFDLVKKPRLMGGKPLVICRFLVTDFGCLRRVPISNAALDLSDTSPVIPAFFSNSSGQDPAI